MSLDGHARDGAAPQARAKVRSETATPDADTEHPARKVPEALKAFMLQGWAPRPAEAVTPIEHVEAFRGRRRALSRMFPHELLLVPTGHEVVRANDTHFPFRPGSDFYYLTGNLEPDCVLVMEPLPDGSHRDVLYVEPSNRDDATFFTDRAKGELWVGARLGVPRTGPRHGVDEARSLATLPAYLDEQRARGGAVRVLRGLDPALDARAPGGGPETGSDAAGAQRERDTAFQVALSEMRILKDEIEVQELEIAIDATRRGFEDVIRALPTARTEREVEGTFFLRARTEGNYVGYGTIAAAGAHACILHWTRNDGPLRPGELLLLDAGVEGRSLYTADITRTIPISGAFSVEQRQIYELVYRAQRAAIASVRPGVDFMEPNGVAMDILARGLEALGILPMPAEEALHEDKQLYRRYTLHNISHMLGLDVHDCARARQQSYHGSELRPGMVLTIEPGLYFQSDDLTVPERFRGIGVRIEDDVLVTEHGSRVLSAGIPAAPDEVEAWVARLWAGHA
ncbi:MAG TPA: aminopeptidase P family protein [Haliangium sp.]|nr:aminopeptidase P family protein [Haliangium sp.]